MRSEELAVRSGGLTLRATLDLPDGPGPHPAIVALHGASDGSRDFFLFRHLALALVPHGVAVLRFDRRGDDVPLKEQAADALAAMALLAARADIAGGRIGLWGFSQGAWVAPLAATRSPAIAFLALVASTGVTPAEQMRYGTQVHLRAAGYGDAEAARLVAARLAVERFHRGEVGRTVAQAAVDAIAREPWFEHAYLRPELPPAPGWWPDADFDPEPVFAGVRVPVLLFYGEGDEWQPIDASIAAWRRAMGGRDLTVVRLPGTGHHPTVGAGREVGDVSPAYTEALVRWVTRVAPAARP